MRDVLTPSSQYSPVVGLSRQPITFMNVDLPDPDGPMIATNSPSWISRETPRSAWTITSPIVYRLCRSATLMIAVESPLVGGAVRLSMVDFPTDRHRRRAPRHRRHRQPGAAGSGSGSG